MATNRKPDPVGSTERDLRFHPSDPDRATTLSAAQVAHYNSEGFIAPIGIFDEAEAREARAYIDDLLDTVLGAEDDRNSYSINSYHPFCRGMYDLVTEPRIVDCVEDLLGSHIVCWGSHLFAKMPHDGKTVPFHQDAIYWPLTPSKTVTVWLAIDDADADNAAMQFVPASHLEGPIEHETHALDGTRVLGTQALGMEDRPARYLNELRAGQMSLHSDLLLHGSEANSSDRRRAGLTIRYAAAEVRLIDGYDIWRSPAIHLRDGDPDDFWANVQRPEGERPDLMAGFFGDFDGQPLTT